MISDEDQDDDDAGSYCEYYSYLCVFSAFSPFSPVLVLISVRSIVNLKAEMLQRPTCTRVRTNRVSNHAAEHLAVEAPAFWGLRFRG